MTPPAGSWNEVGQSEVPAIELLQTLGYTHAAPDLLDGDRDSPRDVVLSRRLSEALKRLNPWASDDSIHKAIRILSNVQAASLIEANEQTHTALSYGVAIEQDLGSGRKSQQLRFIDFDEPANNDFLVTRQFKVKGAKKHIIPDVVCFVNGIPLVTIECKSPTLGDGWKREALDQFDRYQELSDKYTELGAPRLFHTMQLHIATCGQDAVYGTVGTPARFYVRWKNAFPHSDAQLSVLAGKPIPNVQDVTLVGLLTPSNLLDVVRNFIVFERDAGTGRVIKKVPRYQQFGAVNKAITRAASGESPNDRGGVVWATQGSGKSLTMLWLALKLRRDPRHENPSLVIVTDRRDLDEQIERTFRACGFPNPERAESVRDLRTLLTGPSGRTVMTTVQKFQEIGGVARDGKRVSKPKHPVLSEASNIFVLTDEAHRTQYGSLAANLRLALPNAVFFGFTGTPIDKNDRSTLETFGPYIDKYTIEQAVADEATVPIFYESRLPNLHIIGQTLDKVFDRVFADRSDDERRAIKKKYATEQAIAEAPSRIEAICLDLLEHYTQYISPNGFKAQVVAVSRRAAVMYKETLDRLHGPQSAVIMSGSNKDDAALVPHHVSADDRKLLIKRFLRKDDPLKFLIVCDMLLTGFDAPIEQVMYLDSPLKEHTLLQAIARVNRTADAKSYGLVVDYCGVSQALQEALAIFSPSDVQGALRPKQDELPRLQARHAAALQFFHSVRDRNDLSECVAGLEPEDVRARFQTAFLRFSQSMDMMLPEPAALEYSDDLAWLGKVRDAAKATFRDDKLDVSDCGDKVRKLIDQAVVAEGVSILVKEVSLFSGDFDEKLGALKSTRAKASEIEHAIRHEISVKLEEDPAYFQTLRERLERILNDYKARRISEVEQLSLLQALVNDVRGHSKAAEAANMSPQGLAIYGMLKGAATFVVAEQRANYGDDEIRRVSAAIEAAVAPSTAIIDWANKSDALREIRKQIKRQLPDDIYDKAQQEQLAHSLVDVLRARRGK